MPEVRIADNLFPNVNRQSEDKLEVIQIEQYEKFVTSIFEKQATYTTVVVALAYAALFATWSHVADEIDTTAQAWVGILMVVSVGTFVGFEIYKITENSLHLLGLQRQLVNGEITRQEFIERRLKGERKMVLRIGRVWFVMFSVTVLTGFGAAGILGGSFILQILESI